MKIVTLTAAGLALIVWLRYTRRHIDTPAWKPPDRTVTNNRSRR